MVDVCYLALSFNSLRRKIWSLLDNSGHAEIWREMTRPRMTQSGHRSKSSDDRSEQFADTRGESHR
jgi:hypothetical protein